MNKLETQIEQRLIKAGVECHSLIQTFHSQLKERYVLETSGIDCAIENSRGARILESVYSWQMLQRRVVNTLLIVLFGLLHIADGAVTYVGLRFAAVAEVNPILNFFVGIVGLGVSITLFKLTILAVIVLIFLNRHKMKNRWGTASLVSAVTFYCWVVTCNVILIVDA